MENSSKPTISTEIPNLIGWTCRNCFTVWSKLTDKCYKCHPVYMTGVGEEGQLGSHTKKDVHKIINIYQENLEDVKKDYTPPKTMPTDAPKYPG